MKKKLIEKKVKDISLTPNETMVLIKKWKKDDAWASKILSEITVMVKEGKCFLSGNMGKIIDVLILDGYTPAYEAIQERFSEIPNFFYGPPIILNDGKKPSQDFINYVFPLIRMETVREFFKKERIPEYEEKYWGEYFDFENRVLKREDGKDFLLINSIVKDVNKKNKRYKEKDFRSAYEKIVQITHGDD